MKKILSTIKHVVISFAVVILLWQLVASFGGFNPTLFPTPLKILQAFGELASTGLQGSTSDANLFIHIKDSMIRFIIGYIIAVLVGILAGLALGWFPKAFAYVNPVVQIIRPVAPIAWLPFLVLLLGIGDVPAIFIIFLAGVFPILLSTVSAVRDLDTVYLKVAKNFGLSQMQTIKKIVFPAVFPQIATALHLALGTCWIFLVSGEMVGSQTGLGFLIMDAKNSMRMDALLATVITIGIIGFILDQLIGVFEKKTSDIWGFGVKK